MRPKLVIGVVSGVPASGPCVESFHGPELFLSVRRNETGVIRRPRRVKEENLFSPVRYSNGRPMISIEMAEGDQDVLLAQRKYFWLQVSVVL